MRDMSDDDHKMSEILHKVIREDPVLSAFLEDAVRAEGLDSDDPPPGFTERLMDAIRADPDIEQRFLRSLVHGIFLSEKGERPPRPTPPPAGEERQRWKQALVERAASATARADTLSARAQSATARAHRLHEHLASEDVVAAAYREADEALRWSGTAQRAAADALAAIHEALPEGMTIGQWLASDE